MKIKLVLMLIWVGAKLPGFSQSEVTISIGYPDHEGYLVYSIPPSDENARFGGSYYFKVENTGTVNLNNWKIHTFWKALNSTWGIVTKTTLDPYTGEIELTGPTWDTNLDIGENFVLSGEWIPVSSIEDWIEFLPREIEFTADSGPVSIVYNTTGIIPATGFTAQLVKPIDSNRKSFSTPKIVAYFPLFDLDNAWCSLQRYGANIDELRVQLYSITSGGELAAGEGIPDELDPVANLHYWYDEIEALGVIDFCVDHDIELVPVAFNYNSDLGDFDQLAVHNMMIDPTLKSNHIQDIKQVLIDKPLLAGIDVDYESLMASDRELYAEFMEDLSLEIHSIGKLLTTAVHTKVGPGTWYGPQAQDYERIGNAVDEMLLMTYDLHWATSPTYTDPPPTAGCQATPDWMNDVAFFAVSEIDDPSKIQLGIPFYGYRWKYMFEAHDLDDPGIGLTFKDAMDLIEEYNVLPSSIYRESNGNEPNFMVNILGQDWICYFQDSASIAFKLNSLNEYDLRDYIGGVGIWRLGGESDGMWRALVSQVKGTEAIINTEFDCSTNLYSEKEISTHLNIYPNPCSDWLFFDSPEVITSVKVFNLRGELIYQNQTNFKKINVSSWSKGMFIIQITTKDNRIINQRVTVS